MDKFELNIALNGQHWARVELGDREEAAKNRAKIIRDALLKIGGIPSDKWNFMLTRWTPATGRSVKGWE